MMTRRRAAALPMTALGLLGASCATTPIAGAPDTAAAEAHVVDEYIAAYNSRDAERGLALMAEDIYFEDPTMHLLARHREEVRAIVQQGLDSFSDISITPFNRIHASPWAIIQVRLAGTMIRPDGQTRQIDVQGLSMFEIRDGKIVRWYDYFDALTFRQQTR